MLWIREMIALYRKYRQANKDYKDAMNALDARIEELRRG